MKLFPSGYPISREGRGIVKGGRLSSSTATCAAPLGCTGSSEGLGQSSPFGRGAGMESPQNVPLAGAPRAGTFKNAMKKAAHSFPVPLSRRRINRRRIGHAIEPGAVFFRPPNSSTTFLTQMLYTNGQLLFGKNAAAARSRSAGGRLIHFFSVTIVQLSQVLPI